MLKDVEQIDINMSQLNPTREDLYLSSAAQLYSAFLPNEVQRFFALLFSLLPFTREKVKIPQRHTSRFEELL